MRYWGILLAKVAGAAGLIGAAWMAFQALWPEPPRFKGVKLDPFGTDLNYTLIVLLFWLAAVGLGYLILIDQRYRCRTCGRRLHMPVRHGGWQSILLRSPRTDYICRYGHGTLRVPEVDLSGSKPIAWEPIEDMWKELEEIGAADK
jgi:hypothetical protein